jgi:hypothetical protein
MSMWTLPPEAPCRAPGEQVVWTAIISGTEVHVAATTAHADDLAQVLDEATELMHELERPVPPLVLVAAGSEQVESRVLDTLIAGRDTVYVFAPQRTLLGSPLVAGIALLRGCVCPVSSASLGGDEVWGTKVKRLWTCRE